MNKEEIMNEVLVYVKELAQNGRADEINYQTNILSNQAVDSLGIIQLVTFIESKFNIKMEQSDLNFDNLDSVERITNYILSKWKRKK